MVAAKFATTTKHGAIEGKPQTTLTEFFNLDMVISVGYRVKSPRGVIFRRWATGVLRDYLVKGYAINQKRMKASFFLEFLNKNRHLIIKGEK